MDCEVNTYHRTAWLNTGWVSSDDEGVVDKEAGMATNRTTGTGNATPTAQTTANVPMGKTGDN